MTAYAFPCAVKPELFDTGKGRNTRVVRKALRICDTCPVQLACRRAGREGREFGIWGGETQPERWAALGIVESDALPQECGTEKALSRHKSLGVTCETCEQEQSKRDEEAKAAKIASEKSQRTESEEIPGSRVNPFHSPLRPICGTERGYRAHLRRSELQLPPHPQCTCREARQALRAAERALLKEAQVSA
ncbi:WhiB family transcriptional regulator [Streptomyces sp. RLB1-9]|uniref:WhiB family transcriptional regulator n=1 Tax=Streptomyces sp. RLB1-9 TaxID=2594454 RepID=UPI0013DC15E0|nr:WhiB family transcriptional regulator [Streptomyces sp. RLB1-9]